MAKDSITMSGVKGFLRLLFAGVGVGGTLVALTGSLRKAPLPINALGGKQRPWQWRGYDIFATEAGSGPLVILVHGIYAGASSYEYRHLFPLLATTHRVVAFDFLGCGLSASPDIDYSAELFVEQIIDALGEFGCEPTTLVGSSMGGAFCIRAAARATDRVAHLVAISPTGLSGVLDSQATQAQQVIQTLIRTPLIGELLFNALASRPSLRWFLTRQSYADKRSVTPRIVEHFSALTHQRGARYVPAAFIGGALNLQVARDLPVLSIPVLIAWGKRAPSVSGFEHAAEFVRLARAGRLAAFEHSGLLPHEEEPLAMHNAIETFLHESVQPPSDHPA